MARIGAGKVAVLEGSGGDGGRPSGQAVVGLPVVVAGRGCGGSPVTGGKLDLPDPSGPVRIPDRRVIAQARVAFEVRLDNARPDGTGRVLTGDGVVRQERFSDRPAAAPDRERPPARQERHR